LVDALRVRPGNTCQLRRADLIPSRFLQSLSISYMADQLRNRHPTSAYFKIARICSIENRLLFIGKSSSIVNDLRILRLRTTDSK
jgi:hypothetical protein